MTPSEPAFIVRPLGIEDIPALLHIVRSNWSENIAQMAHVEFGQAFNQAVWKPIFYVAEVNGKIVGSAGYHVSWMAYGVYDITWVNAHIDHRNVGIGRALVTRCIDDIRAVGSLAMLSTKSPEYYAKRWGFVTCFEHLGDAYMRLVL